MLIHLFEINNIVKFILHVNNVDVTLLNDDHCLLMIQLTSISRTISRPWDVN